MANLTEVSTSITFSRLSLNFPLKHLRPVLLFLFILLQLSHVSAQAQVGGDQNSGASTVGANSPISTTGTANPSASVSTQTTGGTNVNYQTNNTYQNDFGFAPGIFCRTPTLYMGGNYGEAGQFNRDVFEQNSKSYTNNYAANAGIVVPFGSSVLRDCADLARQISTDRKISNDLSMIRACASLEKDGIKVDPQVYPMLERCARSRVTASSSPQPIRPSKTLKSTKL